MLQACESHFLTHVNNKMPMLTEIGLLVFADLVKPMQLVARHFLLKFQTLPSFYAKHSAPLGPAHDLVHTSLWRKDQLAVCQNEIGSA